MASTYEDFWDHDSFAVVGHSAKKHFPVLTYRGLKQLGKKVVPVDPSESEIEGDRTCDVLPADAEAVVLEVPPDETREWVARAADAGIRDVWIHMNTETPEALDLAREKGLNVRSGTCAVMYLTEGFSYHSLHKWIMKMGGRY